MWYRCQVKFLICFQNIIMRKNIKISVYLSELHTQCFLNFSPYPKNSCNLHNLFELQIARHSTVMQETRNVNF